MKVGKEDMFYMFIPSMFEGRQAVLYVYIPLRLASGGGLQIEIHAFPCHVRPHLILSEQNINRVHDIAPAPKANTNIDKTRPSSSTRTLRQCAQVLSYIQ